MTGLDYVDLESQFTVYEWKLKWKNKYEQS